MVPQLRDKVPHSNLMGYFYSKGFGGAGGVVPNSVGDSCKVWHNNCHSARTFKSLILSTKTHVSDYADSKVLVRDLDDPVQ